MLSTLHTGDAVQAISRIVESFPSEQQRLVRGQLSSALAAVVNQRLVRDVHGKLTLAAEVLMNTPAMARIIRDGHDEQLYGQLEIDARSGNRSMNHALEELVAHRRVLPATVEPFMVARESRSVK